MIFRFAIDLKAIETELGKHGDQRMDVIRQALQDSGTDDMKPDVETLEDAMERLLIVIHTYDLEVSHVAVGVFRNISSGFNLERRHCLEIGKYASKIGHHVLAVEWIQFVQEMTVAKGVSAHEVEEVDQLLRQVILDVRNSNWRRKLQIF